MNGLVLTILSQLIIALILAPPPEISAEIEDPLATSPVVRSGNHIEPGAAISTLRGPTGFAEDAAARGPALHARQISVRIELYPDLVLVEQTYTVHNPDKAIRAVVGVHQSNLTIAPRRTLQASSPLAAAAWLNKEQIQDLDLKIEAKNDGQGNPDGYRLAITAYCPPGESTLSVLTALQSVLSVTLAGVEKPAGTGWSRVGFQVNHYAWGWSPDAPPQDPKITVKLSAHGGTSLSRIHAEEWTEAQTDGRAIWWQGAPWVVLKYDASSGAQRALTGDELSARARQLVNRRPRMHLVAPPDLRAMTRPNRTQESRPIDQDRTRRAMLVPTTILAILLLIAFLVARHQSKKH
jgi:hypothetical protein